MVKKRKEEKVKEEGYSWKRFFIVLGLFILAFVFYSFASALLALGIWLWGFILFLLGIATNIFIFIKGKKIAVIFGVFLLIGSIVLILIFSFVGLITTKEISAEEQQQILESKGEYIENLFNGFENKNHDVFSRDLNSVMKERYDKITFFNLYDELGKIISRDCLKAEKSSTGDEIVYCDVEAENKKTSWFIRFNRDNTIGGLYLTDIYPNVTIDIKSREIASIINIVQNGAEVQLNHAENNVFLILNVSIKNNEDKEIKIHNFKFSNGKYMFSLIQEIYEPADCNLIRKADIGIGEEKQGCLIFSIYEEDKEGFVVVI